MWDIFLSIVLGKLIEKSFYKKKKNLKKNMIIYNIIQAMNTLKHNIASLSTEFVNCQKAIKN
jgi:hypothetical protein